MPSKKPAKAVIKTAKNKETYVNYKAPNNETLATTETFKKKGGAKNNIKAMKKVAKNMKVKDETKKPKNK